MGVCWVVPKSKVWLFWVLCAVCLPVCALAHDAPRPWLTEMEGLSPCQLPQVAQADWNEEHWTEYYAYFKRGFDPLGKLRDDFSSELARTLGGGNTSAGLFNCALKMFEGIGAVEKLKKNLNNAYDEFLEKGIKDAKRKRRVLKALGKLANARCQWGIISRANNIETDDFLRYMRYARGIGQYLTAVFELMEALEVPGFDKMKYIPECVGWVLEGFAELSNLTEQWVQLTLKEQHRCYDLAFASHFSGPDELRRSYPWGNPIHRAARCSAEAWQGDFDALEPTLSTGRCCATDSIGQPWIKPQDSKTCRQYVQYFFDCFKYRSYESLRVLRPHFVRLFSDTFPTGDTAAALCFRYAGVALQHERGTCKDGPYWHIAQTPKHAGLGCAHLSAIGLRTQCCIERQQRYQEELAAAGMTNSSPAKEYYDQCLNTASELSQKCQGNERDLKTVKDHLPDRDNAAYYCERARAGEVVGCAMKVSCLNKDKTITLYKGQPLGGRAFSIEPVGDCTLRGLRTYLTDPENRKRLSDALLSSDHFPQNLENDCDLKAATFRKGIFSTPLRVTFNAVNELTKRAPFVPEVRSSTQHLGERDTFAEELARMQPKDKVCETNPNRLGVEGLKLCVRHAEDRASRHPEAKGIQSECQDRCQRKLDELCRTTSWTGPPKYWDHFGRCLSLAARFSERIPGRDKEEVFCGAVVFDFRQEPAWESECRHHCQSYLSASRKKSPTMIYLGEKDKERCRNLGAENYKRYSFEVNCGYLLHPRNPQPRACNLYDEVSHPQQHECLGLCMASVDTLCSEQIKIRFGESKVPRFEARP